MELAAEQILSSESLRSRRNELHLITSKAVPIPVKCEKNNRL